MMTFMRRQLLPIALFAALSSVAFAQQAATAPLPTASGSSDGKRTVDSPPAPAPSSDYILGPGDLLSVFVTDLEDKFDGQTFRIDVSGDLILPYAGKVHAAGLTADGLGRELIASLTRIIKAPDAVVGVVEFHSQPVSVLGEVGNPGMYQVQGQKNLLQAISLAGGFAEDVGNTVTITRGLEWGRVPLPDAHDDATGKFSVATVSVKSILHSTSPEQNVQVMPGDVISASKTETVYVVGTVNMPGGFPMGQDDTLSALQVLSLAQGPEPTAALQSAKIIRLAPGSQARTELPINLKQLLAGRVADVRLQPGDILFVPNSNAKTVTYRSLQAIVAAATGIAIWGGPGAR
jgi:polysaccharide export outer membrane protein